uniref:Uncharacterized protein n=1 Tax=Oryza punctata TaxID=4537 RepID=A0A0E0LAT6_ORYPU
MMNSSVNQKKELLFLTSGNGAKGADEKSSLLKLNSKLDQAKKKFSPYNYDNQEDGYDRVYYDGDSDKHMLFDYEAVKIKMENLDLYWYSGANEINNKPELDLSNKKLSRHNNGNPSHGHDHILLDKKKLLPYIYGNPANKHVRLRYNGRSDNHMVFNTESMKLKKGDLYQFSGVKGIDQKPELNLAKKKFSRYVYGNPANGHHVHYDGRSDKYMVLNYEAKKLKKKLNSDLYQHSEANAIDKKHKLNLSKKKFSRYIYGNLADEHHHVHLATKKFSHYIYGNLAVGRHGHNDKYMVPNYEAMKLKKKNSDLYQQSEVNEIDKKPKLKLVKKKFSRYIYGNLEDGHDHVHLAKKKLSHYYTYGNPENGHEHFNHHGHSDNHIVFNKEAVKLRKGNSNWYYYSGLKEIDKKHKPDLANKKFARYIYSTPANERPFL